MIDQELIEFVSRHKHDDIHRLLLSCDKYPGVDVKIAAKLITTNRMIGKKVSSWQDREGLYFPNIVSVEQASSEVTASYKQRFVKGGIVLDITGGIGVDSYFLAQDAEHLYYYERNKEICEATQNNFKSLNVNNVTFFNKEISKDNIGEQELSYADLVYIDPSRRDINLNKVKSISDYQPNIPDLKDHIFKLTNNILIKISPMVDISATIEQIPEVMEVHVLSVNNECKELLFLLGKKSEENEPVNKDVQIFTTNFCNGGINEVFNFSSEQERRISCNLSDDELSTYLYEPNSSILKAGAFKSIGEHFRIAKLNKSTHLYTKSSKIDEFPGRRFFIKDKLDFKKENIKNFSDRYPCANISVRNFPLSPEELKKLLKVKDGGDLYIFGCTVSSGARKILVCTKDN